MQSGAERVRASPFEQVRRQSAVIWSLGAVVGLTACDAPSSSSLFSGVGGADLMVVATLGHAGSAGSAGAPSGGAPMTPEGPGPSGLGGQSGQGTGGSGGRAMPSAPDAGVPANEDMPSVMAPPPVGIVFTDASEACTLPAGAPDAATLFSAPLADDACRTNLDAPYETFWYAYQDREAAPAVSQGVAAPGCREDSCSLHVQGPIEGEADFTVYGAGVGFPLAAGDAELDASGFSGIQYWARGEIQGTRGPANSESPQTLLLKVVSATSRLGDDFGRYCRIDPVNWTLCRQEFSELVRDGYVSSPDPRTDTLDVSELVRIQFEFPLHRDAGGFIPTPVRFDVELAAISFF